MIWDIRTRSECTSRMEHGEIPKKRPEADRERSLRTDVDEVALAVQHDVPVVSVFDLQQEEQQAVSCHAADEVVSRLEFGKMGEILSPDKRFKAFVLLARPLPSGKLRWIRLRTGSWNSRTCRSLSAAPAGRETCSQGCTRSLHTAGAVWSAVVPSRFWQKLMKQELWKDDNGRNILPEP